MSIAIAATPDTPNRPATKASSKNIKAKFNMVFSLCVALSTSCGPFSFACLRGVSVSRSVPTAIFTNGYVAFSGVLKA